MNSNRKPNIAVVFHDTLYTSGGTRSLLDLVDKMLEMNKLNLICVFPNQTGTAIDYLKNKGVEIITTRYWYCTRPINCSCADRLKLRLKLKLSYYNIKKLVKSCLKEKNVDLVYSNTGVILAGAWISKMLNVPHIWHIREFLEEDHGITPIWNKKKYYDFINNNSDGVVLISNALREKHGKEIDEHKISVIYDDLSENYLLTPTIEWENRKSNILFAGTICEGKGQLTAVKALSILKRDGISVNLYIAGSVKDRDRCYYNILMDEIKKNDLQQQVEFLGQVQNLSEVRKNMGIGVVASCSEAFGRVTVEGMLADMVMIGADAGGTAELIDDNETGYLYPLGDEDKLAQTIKKVLDLSMQESVRIRENALEHSKSFIKGNCAEKVTELFYRCVEVNEV